MSGPFGGQALRSKRLRPHPVAGEPGVPATAQKLHTLYTGSLRSEQMFVDPIQMRFLHWRR